MDASTLESWVGKELAATGRDLVGQGRCDEVDEDGGGASGVINDPDLGPLESWVGVVDGELVADCACTEDPAENEDVLCHHAVAVAFAALDAGITFVSISGPVDRADTDEEWYAEVAGRLTHADLIEFVAERASIDEEFADALVDRAGESDQRASA